MDSYNLDVFCNSNSNKSLNLGIFITCNMIDLLSKRQLVGGAEVDRSSFVQVLYSGEI